MNITFFIGNGFDINLGLKTNYSCFYPYFLENARSDNMIKIWLDGNEQYWSDLEEKLGQEIEKVTKLELEKFYEDKEEMDQLLIEYLEKEQEKYKIEDSDDIKKEFSRSMAEFFLGLPDGDINSIQETRNEYKNEDFIYTYVTFNYTDILDRIVSLYENSYVIGNHDGISSTKKNLIGKVLHVHGTTNEEMILGVNDESQINNLELRSEEIFLNTFIKRNVNTEIGQQKTEKVIDIINKSHIICIFGMSIGNTDKMWWEELIKWLNLNESNKLIIFCKKDEKVLKRKISSAIIRLNEKIRKEIFQKGNGKNDEEAYLKIKNRIMISYNSTIFSLPKVSDE